MSRLAAILKQKTAIEEIENAADQKRAADQI
jgi:hypothetical protein